MLLRKYMSMLGIGSAKIDLRLNKVTYIPGEVVKGHFHIQGGTIEQQVKRIECDLIKKRRQLKESDETIETFTIYTSKKIDQAETNEMEFQFTLPSCIEYSSDEIKYQFATRMIFNEGIKSEDQDEIFILSNRSNHAARTI